MPEPASEQGGDVLDLWRVLFLTAVAIGLLVIGLIAWSVFRYRRGGRGDGEPPQFRDNIRLEVFYTAVPLVIVAVLFGLTVGTQRRVTKVQERPDLRVEVQGFQWGWRFHYPEEAVTVVGDSNDPPTLVLPVGRTVGFELSSTDVIHSFYVPAFLDKRDVVPGEENRVDVATTRVGRFSGLCAEFCGLDHARMGFTVDVVPVAEFEAWLAAQRQVQPRPSVPGTAQ
ncbi:MAG TPA: cytochrome c oxidase subunit II [Acidimicrobiales bacterium]|nr:cytochrome c oxidase subunit II [Acidimicrobiales bacterium]